MLPVRSIEALEISGVGSGEASVEDRAGGAALEATDESCSPLAANEPVGEFPEAELEHVLKKKQRICASLMMGYTTTSYFFYENQTEWFKKNDLRYQLSLIVEQHCRG